MDHDNRLLCGGVDVDIGEPQVHINRRIAASVHSLASSKGFLVLVRVEGPGCRGRRGDASNKSNGGREELHFRKTC